MYTHLFINMYWVCTMCLAEDTITLLCAQISHSHCLSFRVEVTICLAFRSGHKVQGCCPGTCPVEGPFWVLFWSQPSPAGEGSMGPRTSHWELVSTKRLFTRPSRTNSGAGPVSWECTLCSHSRALCSETPTLGLRLCCHCLETLNNFIFELVFCKWSLMWQWTCRRAEERHAVPSVLHLCCSLPPL